MHVLDGPVWVVGDALHVPEVCDATVRPLLNARVGIIGGQWTLWGLHAARAVLPCEDTGHVAACDIRYRLKGVHQDGDGLLGKVSAVPACETQS